MNRREGGNTDHEILGARIIDRTLRPLFPKGYSPETQIICSVTSIDRDAPPDTVSIAASSAALAVSDIPWHGPAAAVHIGWVDGYPVLNPTRAEQEVSTLDVLYAGTETRTLMLEVSGEQVPEHELVAALRAGQASLKEQCALYRELARMAGRPKREWDTLAPDPDVMEAARASVYAEARKAYASGLGTKKDRSQMQGRLQAYCLKELKLAFSDRPHGMLAAAASAILEDALRDAVLAQFTAVEPSKHQAKFRGPASLASATEAGSDEMYRLALSAKEGGEVVGSGEVLSRIEQELSDRMEAPRPPTVPVSVYPYVEASTAGYSVGEVDGGRPDGRSARQLRELYSEIEVIPVVHGSSLFARGATQALCTTTLGPLSMWQLSNARRDPLAPVEPFAKAFMLHYEFPPYSVNEVGRVGGINRRMVGHGALAQKAVAPVMPRPEEFPYTVRVTSEIAGSDGSSSMATVCGASLALMDAGVPLKEHVAGISIGMVSSPEMGKLEYGAWGADGSFRARNAGGPVDGTSAPSDPVEGSSSSSASDDGLPELPGGRSAILLTDILGLEDHCGDMDFKIAGTRHGVTAVYLDLKLPGIPLELLEAGVWRAREARDALLERMEETLPMAKEGLRDTAPRIDLIMVPQSKRGQVVGPGARNLRRIERETNSQLTFFGDTDYLQIFARDHVGLTLARRLVEELVLLPSPESVGALGILGSPEVPFAHARATQGGHPTSPAAGTSGGATAAARQTAISTGPYYPPSVPDLTSVPYGVPLLSDADRKRAENEVASGQNGGISMRNLMPDLYSDPGRDVSMDPWKYAELMQKEQEVTGPVGSGDATTASLPDTPQSCRPGTLVRARVTGHNDFGCFVTVLGAVTAEAESESAPSSNHFIGWPSYSLPQGYLHSRNSMVPRGKHTELLPKGTEVVATAIDVTPQLEFQLDRVAAAKAGVPALYEAFEQHRSGGTNGQDRRRNDSNDRNSSGKQQQQQQQSRRERQASPKPEATEATDESGPTPATVFNRNRSRADATRKPHGKASDTAANAPSPAAKGTDNSDDESASPGRQGPSLLDVFLGAPLPVPTSPGALGSSGSSDSAGSYLLEDPLDLLGASGGVAETAAAAVGKEQKYGGGRAGGAKPSAGTNGGGGGQRKRQRGGGDRGGGKRGPKGGRGPSSMASTLAEALALEAADSLVGSGRQ